MLPLVEHQCIWPTQNNEIYFIPEQINEISKLVTNTGSYFSTRSNLLLQAKIFEDFFSTGYKLHCQSKACHLNNFVIKYDFKIYYRNFKILSFNICKLTVDLFVQSPMGVLKCDCCGQAPPLPGSNKITRSFQYFVLVFLSERDFMYAHTLAKNYC